MGDLNSVYLTGDYAQGRDSGVLDLIFVGTINKNYLLKLVEKAEGIVKKKIRYLTYDATEWSVQKLAQTGKSKSLLLWENPAKATNEKIAFVQDRS
jgi:hypothetical protein